MMLNLHCLRLRSQWQCWLIKTYYANTRAIGNGCLQPEIDHVFRAILLMTLY